MNLIQSLTESATESLTDSVTESLTDSVTESLTDYLNKQTIIHVTNMDYDMHSVTIVWEVGSCCLSLSWIWTEELVKLAPFYMNFKNEWIPRKHQICQYFDSKCKYYSGYMGFWV